MGAYEKSTDVNQIVAVYEKYRENPENAYRVCSMGIIYRDPEDSYYDDAEFAIVKGNTVFGSLMDDVRFYGELALVREGIEKIHEALPDYKYVPMRDVREAMYPEKMTTEQLAEALDEIAEAFDPYEYRDNVEMGENTVQEVMLDLQSGNIHYYVSYLKDIVDEECDLSVRAGVLMERLKAYEPELPKDLEPMVYVNYCEESSLMNPRCQKLSELDAKTAEMDKEWYEKRDPKTEEPAKIAKIYVTVYYAEKGEQMLHHFKNGKLKDRSNIWREMKKLKEKAGVAESKIFPHNFRHLFARIYYKVTKDITGLADLLGHSSINVTRIYTATTESVFQKKLDKIVEQEILECTT